MITPGAAQDPLANLHPLREPEVIGWWPLAPGWWLLLALVLIALAWLGWRWFDWRRRNRYRRLGSAQQLRLFQQYSADGDRQHFVSATNALLKSVALQAYPPAQVAASHGQRWIDFLNVPLPAQEHFDSAFAEAVYQAGATELDLDRLQRSALRWINSHEVTP